jgi:hypothetical protein
MKKKILNRSNPVIGKAIRIAPARNGVLAAFPWKFLANQNDIYVVNREIGDITKISIHESGKIYMHQGATSKLLTPPVRISGGVWMHLLQIGFFLSAGAGAPADSDMKDSKKVIHAEVELTHVLHLDLCLASGVPSPSMLPVEFKGAHTCWRTALQDGRAVILLAGAIPMNDEMSDYIRYVREVRRPHAILPKDPGARVPYIEIMDMNHDAQGNVIRVTPMGREGWTVNPETQSP